jgi:putative acetyltransferase
MTIAIEAPRQRDLLELLRLSDEYALSLYPAESCYLLDVGELEGPDVTVFVSRAVSGMANGMAALVNRRDGSGELKRMFVLDSARGRGVARALLAVIEECAGAQGIHTLQLETGPKQLDAVALYKSAGFRSIPNFGPYVGDQFSVCMEKRLPES